MLYGITLQEITDWILDYENLLLLFHCKFHIIIVYGLFVFIVQVLILTIEEAMAKLPTSRRPRVSAEKLTLLSVWQLSNQESYRDIADRFDLSIGHAHRCFSLFVKTLCSKVEKYIMWPMGNKGLQTLHDFSNLRDIPFPGTFAAVDGCHICIPSPRVDRASYYNRKGFHSILLQGICDSQKRFIDIFVGWPGSSHDARVWKNSPIYNFLATHTEEYLPCKSHIVGDTAYPVDTFLMCPYKDNGHLTKCQKRFNVTLSSSRVVIEQAFGLLKGRFRRLKYLDMSDLRLAPKVVTVACILHNLCLENDGDDDEYFDAFITDDLLCDSEDESHSRLGHAKRDTIAASLLVM